MVTFRPWILSGIFLVSVALQATNAFSEDGAQVRVLSSSAADKEQYERDVDRAALSAQESSIAKLSSLLKKYGGTRQEPILLAKLAELQQQKAAILFRVAHGKAHRKGGKGSLNLASYHQSLSRSISTLNTLIAKYPHFVEIPAAYFSRGKAYEELENKNLATKDYSFLVKNFPEAEQTSPAYMSLAEFAIEANRHSEAIRYLRELEKRPEDPQYPFALYKLAWSYYNLKNIPQSLYYAEKQIAFYNDRHSSSDDAASDAAIKENTLLDVPVFYFSGLEEGDDRYPTAKALDYFRKLENGPMLGKMLLRFSKLLRSRNMQADLIGWNRQILDQEWRRPESLDVLIITYEFLQNKRNFAALVDTAKDLVGLYRKYGRERLLKHESLHKAQKMILDTAENLQTVIVKNKQTEEARALSVTLAALYDAFTQVVSERDPRIPQVHYNLAETLFTIRDFEAATTHYRWVVERMGSMDKAVRKTVGDAGLKAISSRYEVLRTKKLIPTEVKAVSFSEDSKKPAEMDPVIETWISWIDAEKEKGKSWENFNFEANRTLYRQGDLARALERLEDFAEENPQSANAIPSASLVLDTSIASGDWDAVFEKATRFRKLDSWKTTEFGKRLYEAASDALYKKMELRYQAKDYKSAIRQADSFLAEYKQSSRIPDCLSLAGAAALAQGDKVKAMSYFSLLISSDKDAGRVGEALRARAAIQEEGYQFASAAADYRTYLNLADAGSLKGAKDLDELRRKALALAWLSDDPSDLNSAIQAKSVCTAPLEDECEKYRAISSLRQLASIPVDGGRIEQVFNRFRKMNSSEAKTLWAIFTLQGAKHLAFRDRNLTLRTIGSGWKDLDPLAKFFVLPYLNDSVVKAFQMNRVSMKEVAPLRADERYITRRVEVIRELENAIAKIMELPWSRIRAESLNVLASTYQDLSHGLSELPAPKGLNDSELASYQETIRKLTLPFEEKGQDIRSKAFDIASRSMIEEEAFASIGNLFFAENPSQAKKLKSMTADASSGAHIPRSLKSTELSLDYLPYIREVQSLSQASRDEKAVDLFYSEWVKAIRDRNWVEVAFFLQEAKEKNLTSPEETGLIRAVSLASIGARGEAMAELEETRKTLNPRIKAVVTLTLAQACSRSYASEKAKAFYADFVPPAPIVATKAGEKGRSPASDQKVR